MWNAAILKKNPAIRVVLPDPLMQGKDLYVGTVEPSTPIVCMTDDGPKPDTMWLARSSLSNEVFEFWTRSAAEFWLGVHGYVRS